jgi:hypothetical protein
MFGRKISTPPTPAITPSTSSDCSRLSEPSGQKPAIVSPSQPNAASIQSIGGVPTVKVSQNTTYIRPRKIGRPQTRWMTISSMRSDAVWRVSTATARFPGRGRR